jgi:WD40 repeat protein
MGDILLSSGKLIKLWRYIIRICEKELKNHTASVMNLEWSPNYEFFVSSSSDYTLQIWNHET